MGHIIKILVPALITLFWSTCSLAQNNLEVWGASTIEDCNEESDNALTLTPASSNTVGAALYTKSVDLNEGFELTIEANFGDQDELGGEGICFVMIDTGSTPFSPQATGGRMGYGQLSPSLGIEIDTKQQPEFGDTIDEDHIAIVIDGKMQEAPAFGPVTARHPRLDTYYQDITPGLSNPLNIEDGQAHEIRLQWDAQLQLLEVFFDGFLRVAYHKDLVQEVFNGRSEINVGVVAANSTSGSEQSICFKTATINGPPRDFLDCNDLIDLNHWITLNDPDDGAWETNNPATQFANTVTQLLDERPSLFVMPAKIIDFNLEFNVQVTSAPNGDIDDDYIGMVFGLNAPFGQQYQDYDMFLFDWKASPNNLCMNGLSVPEGKSLARLTGNVVSDCNLGSDHYLGTHRDNPPEFDLLDSIFGQGEGWELDSTYRIRLQFLSDAINIWINDVKVFEESGQFDPGYFGFYTYSQAHVTFSKVTLDLLPEFTKNLNELCEGETANFHSLWTGEMLPPFIEETKWIFSDKDTIINETALQHRFDSAGWNYISLIATGTSGCTAEYIDSIRVHPIPVFDLGEDTLICQDEFLIYLAPPFSEAQVTWQDGSNESGYIATTSGQYSAQVVLNGCEYEDTIKITNRNPPSYTTNIVHECDDIRKGSVEIQVEGNTAPYQVNLNGVSGTTFSSLQAGDYLIQIKDGFGCAVEEYLQIMKAEQPLYDFDIGDETCSQANDGFIELIALDQSLKFLMFDEEIINEGKFQGLSEGSYSFLIEDDLGCQYEDTFSIVGSPNLELQITNDTTINYGQTLQLKAQLSHGAQNIYLWSGDSLSCYSCPTPYISPVKNSIYRLVATTGNGCQVRAEVVIMVNNDLRVFFPTAFSPNNDGINEVFFAWSETKNHSIKAIRSFRVFGKGGNLIFDQPLGLPNDPTFGWDGTFKGELLNGEVYMWTAIVEHMDGREFFRTGAVTLMR